MKYRVIIPWHGVKKGQIVEFKKLHPALKSNVEPVEEPSNCDKGTLTVATPEADTAKQPEPEPEVVSEPTEQQEPEESERDRVKRLLTEANIEFDGRASTDNLKELLPK